jgi:hypothetical protein
MTLNCNMWTLYVITDKGTKIPHWTDTTRAKCRKMQPTVHSDKVRFLIERSDERGRQE